MTHNKDQVDESLRQVFAHYKLWIFRWTQNTYSDGGKCSWRSKIWGYWNAHNNPQQLRRIPGKQPPEWRPLWLPVLWLRSCLPAAWPHAWKTKIVPHGFARVEKLYQGKKESMEFQKTPSSKRMMPSAAVSSPYFLTEDIGSASRPQRVCHHHSGGLRGIFLQKFNSRQTATDFRALTHQPAK